MAPRDDGVAPVAGIAADRAAPSVPGPQEGSRQGGPAAKPPADGGSGEVAVEVGEALRRQLAAQGAHITFQKDEESGKLIVQIKDSSGRVIRQIPADEMLRLAKAIDRYLGLLVDRHS